MSKKFFSLIHGDSIHAAPNTKFIASEEFSRLIDANELISEVENDVKKYKVAVAAESEKLKEQAQKEGYEDGFRQWAEHVAKLEAQIIQVRKDFEKLLMPIALKAAKKIVEKEIKLSESTIFDIVASSLKAVATHKKIVIYAGKKDIEILEAHRPQIKQLFESLESLSLRENPELDDEEKRGSVIIETEGGIINARIDNKWQVLEKALLK